MFRLEPALRDWCAALRACGYEDEESIEELQDHIVCVIEELKNGGLTEEEAFLAATGRLGDVAALAAELGKKGFDMAATIKTSDVALSTRQISTMLYAGVPLEQSLDIVAEAQPNAEMQAVIREMRDDVSSGKTCAEAFRAHPDPFDELFCRLVDAGEKADKLAPVMDRIATYKEKTVALGSRITRCIRYLGAVLATVLVAVAVVTPGWNVAVAVGVAFGMVLAYLVAVTASGSLRAIHHGWVLKLPVFGGLLRNAEVARFARVLSATFLAGVSFSEALDWVIGTARNSVYRDAFVKLQSDVSNGKLLNQSMRETGLFPELIIKMVDVGEHAGALDMMLDKAATYYEERVDNAIAGLASLGQPVLNGMLIAMILYLAFVGS